MMRNKFYFVNVWITLRCNFSCRYCYVKPYYKNSDMDYSRADQMVKFIKDTIGLEQELILNFHGGEPLLNIDVIKYIINKIRTEIKNLVQFGITTNGSLIDDEIVNFLANTFSYNLSISIDGKKKTHDFNRKCKEGKIDYDSLLNNALKLLNINKKTRIRMTFDKYNVNELYENIKFFIDKGFKYIVPTADIFAIDWSDQDFEKVKEELAKIKLYAIEKNTVIHLVDNEFEFLPKCNAGEDYYSIDPDGNIYPCTFLVGRTEMIIGDCSSGLKKEKLEEIKKILNNKVSECEECAMFGKCISTRCLFTNFATVGDYYKPNLVECNMLNIKHLLSKSIQENTQERHMHIRKEM